MRVVGANCDHCGAPLEIPLKAKRVTCLYCDTALEVVEHRCNNRRCGVVARVPDARPSRGVPVPSPIDAENTISRWLFCVTSNMVDIAGEEWIQSMQTGVLQDMRIWKNKIYRGEPVLCEADTYLAEYRKWVKQFYTDPL